jgi:tRNA U34 5-methylaminomethyl-2-thiouridine-forming methyltransferase MnmC
MASCTKSAHFWDGVAKLLTLHRTKDFTMDFSSDHLQQRVQLVQTSDGSQTLSVDGGVEHYHSTNGAIAEALHVYINAGLAPFLGREVNVFEVGFGTGLNAMLTYQFAVSNGTKVSYTSIERYPLPLELTAKLTYPEQVGLDREKYFNALHCAPWNSKVELDSYFSLQKIEGDLVEYSPSSGIDVVFFDAFAPDLQPQLWSLSIFEKVYKAMNEGGVLVTYSSKGFVKNNLRESGFDVKRLQGPKGKRHMILAQK